MDIIEKLIMDHDKLKKVMDDMASLYNKNSFSSDEQESLFKSFKELYYSHTKLEEDCVYPVFQKYQELKKLILKGFQAHHVVDVGLLELKILPYASDSWFPKFLVIRDGILNHMDDEETLVFEEAKKIVKKSELDALGNKAKSMSLNK